MTEFVVAECERCGAKWLIETDEWRDLHEWMMESDVGWDLVRDPGEDCQISDSNPGKTLMFRIPTETELKTMILDEKVPTLDGRPNHQRDAEAGARAFTTTKRCGEAFAKLNGWSVAKSGHFSFRQLAGKGRTRSNDEAPRWWTGDRQDVDHVMDHLEWFRQNRKPIAIVSMPYHASIEDAQELAQHYGLVVCAPPIDRSGWWLPKYTRCYAFVRPGTTVRWLPTRQKARIGCDKWSNSRSGTTPTIAAKRRKKKRRSSSSRSRCCSRLPTMVERKVRSRCRRGATSSTTMSLLNEEARVAGTRLSRLHVEQQSEAVMYHCKENTMGIPDSVLDAITAVVYWARSSDGPDDILEYDIPLLDDWIVKLGLLPPAETPITDEDWIKFDAAKAAWEAGRHARQSQCD